jgi:hypothetical protein
MPQHSDLSTSKANGRLPTHTYHYLDGQIHLVRLQTDNFCLFLGKQTDKRTNDNFLFAVAHGPAPCEDPPCGLHMWCVYTHIYM